MTQSRRLRLLHTSDLHLGLHSTGQERLDRPALSSLAGVASAALHYRADLVLIAGDLFDHNRLGPDLIEAALQQLRRLPMPVVVLPGNHDCLAPGSVYRRFDFSAETGNTFVLADPQGEALSFPGLDVAIWGRPHASYDDYQPLADAPPRGRERWQIALAHGHFVHSHEDWGRAYPILPQELLEAQRDYIALGHQDRFEAVSNGPVPAYYSGSPVLTRACALVDLGPAGTTVTSVPLPNTP